MAQLSKYQAIVAELRRRIVHGELAPGERLPSQQQLAGEFNVTVMTLRRAIADLARAGLLFASQGVGTYVVEEPYEYRLGHLSSFAQDMNARGLLFTTEVLSIDTNDDADALESLQLPSESRCTRIVRRRVIDGRPAVLQESFLPTRIGERLTVAKLEAESLYDLLASEFEIVVVRAFETLRATAIGANDAKVLERPLRTPAMLSVRLSFNAVDQPVLFDRALLPGDSTEVVADRQLERLHIAYNVDRQRDPPRATG